MTMLLVTKSDGDHAIAQLGPVFVGIFRKRIPVESVMLQVEQQKRAIKELPLVGLVNVIEPDCGRMDAQTREFISQWSKQKEFGKVRTVNVVEAGGLSGAMLRTVLKTVGLTIPKEARAEVVSDVTTASRWIKDHVPNAAAPSELVAAIEDLRKKIGRAAAI